MLLENVTQKVMLFVSCFSCGSKAFSVDHNKPVIVPAGQDTLAQIGELLSSRLSLLYVIAVYKEVLQSHSHSFAVQRAP